VASNTQLPIAVVTWAKMATFDKCGNIGEIKKFGESGHLKSNEADQW